MSLPQPEYGYSRTLKSVSFGDAVTQVTEALKTEGFGVLTTIDVRETMKKKLDVDFRPYVILGACNPPIAHKALTAEPGIGLFLPCNVTVAQDDDGSIVVQALKPSAMMQVVKNAALEPLMQDAEGRLQRAMEKLGAPHA